MVPKGDGLCLLKRPFLVNPVVARGHPSEQTRRAQKAAQCMAVPGMRQSRRTLVTAKRIYGAATDFLKVNRVVLPSELPT